MSLINDVLREIEARQSEGHDARSAGQRPPARPGRRTTRRWPWWLVIAVVVGAALHLIVQNSAPDFGQPALHASLSDSLSKSTAQESAAESVQQPEIGSSSEPWPVASIEVTPSEPAIMVDNSNAESEPTAAQTGVPVAQARPTDPSPILESTTAVDTAEAAAGTPSDPQPSTFVIERADRDRSIHDDPYLAAQRSLARGRQALAESQLRTLVEARPDHARARYLLASLLLNQQRVTAAVALLEDGLNRADPALAASLLGRLLAEQGDSLRARQVLSQHAPALELDPDYHLLLAAVERQQGDHQAAHDRYLALTVASPDRSIAWIGLGTSLESLGQASAAREAYQQALTGRDRQAASFARDRLNAIPDKAGASP